MEKENIFLQKVVDWFTTVKAPDLKEKVEQGFIKIKSGNHIEDIYKKLFGFILFSYSMNHGPASFFDVEEAAKEIGVAEEMAFYATDWINHSKKKSNPIQQ